MTASRGFPFAVIGISHNHIYAQTDCMLGAGCALVAFFADEDDLATRFSERYPQARRVQDQREILEDEKVRLVVGAGIPADRAPMAVLAMRHGKDVMLDKPGATTLTQLAELKAVQQETGRIVSICFSEHLLQPATIEAGKLVQAGAIGQVIQTIGLGPHQLGNYQRPAWFFDKSRYGGILADVGAHQAEQFLFFTNSTEATVVASQIGNFANPGTPGLDDFGDMVLRSQHATGYCRLDWFTPDGLGVWGDGRYTILGTDGYIELRKYIDIAGRRGDNHLFIAAKKSARPIDCSRSETPYGPALRNDVLDRTETAMPQARCFLATELALKAQANATRVTGAAT
ncbi:MAG: Gfo/Idh/MocA family protein [Geminicoccaceae bacterium]